jgi:hypothetical protein
VLKRIPNLKNETNRQLINQYHKYLIARDTSENHQKHNIKIIIIFSEYIDPLSFYDVKVKNIILDYLDKRKKNKQEDPDQKWITTWNVNGVLIQAHYMPHGTMYHHQYIQYVFHNLIQEI